MKNLFTRKNLINLIGIIALTIVFLKAYNINNVGDLISKIEYNLINWKHLNFIDIIVLIASYVGYVTNDTLKKNIIDKLLNKRGVKYGKSRK